MFKKLYNLEHKIEKTYDFNLESYKEFLKGFNNPQLNIGRIIHVAGTNGKGSVAEMISSILLSAGYRVGTYTSPHIKEVNERIKFNGRKISDREFSLLEKKVYREISKGEKSYRTYFEGLTTLAFLYFEKKKCEFSVIEVGLGGRLDSTNVVQSEVQIITKIGLDHTDLLGNTLEKIASEKSGIIKESSVVFTFNQNDKVMEELRKKASIMHAEIHAIDCEEVKEKSRRIFEFEKRSYRINQLGKYQMENAALCIKTAEHLKINRKTIREGVKNFRIEGRMEILSKNPLIIADGSHNPHAIERTMGEIKMLYPKKRITSVSIFMADKDYKKSIEILKKYADKVILTEIPFFRCAKKNDYSHLKVDFEENPKKALRAALGRKNSLIIFIGSFYLISEARDSVKSVFQSLHS
ncbi:MAG: bifunctional folylpolyglutamate synthase/dihydrofolate synthase [bacterium]|nr:bifunctional folylpolyglutamate synthase/dihydrofolate synthase [bacterium]